MYRGDRIENFKNNTMKSFKQRLDLIIDVTLGSQISSICEINQYFISDSNWLNKIYKIFDNLLFIQLWTERICWLFLQLSLIPCVLALSRKVIISFQFYLFFGDTTTRNITHKKHTTHNQTTGPIVCIRFIVRNGLKILYEL